jgi:hypothetical protein
VEILIYLITYLIAIAITTAVLAASLFLVEDIRSSSFKEFGAVPTLARCAGLCIVTNLLGLLPFGWLLGLVVWFVGIMLLFQKTFGQTLILFVINALFGCGVAGAIGFLLGRMVGDGATM